MIAAALCADARGAEEASAMLSPQALQEIAQVETEIDRIEAQTIERLAAPPDNQVQQVELQKCAPSYPRTWTMRQSVSIARSRSRRGSI